MLIRPTSWSWELLLLDDVQLEESIEDSELLLGVNIQCDLKWSEQISSLESKLKTRLAGLEKLKYVMDKADKKTIIQGVFNSVLCYCLEASISLRSMLSKFSKTEQLRLF